MLPGLPEWEPGSTRRGPDSAARPRLAACAACPAAGLSCCWASPEWEPGIRRRVPARASLLLLGRLALLVLFLPVPQSGSLDWMMTPCASLRCSFSSCLFPGVGAWTLWAGSHCSPAAGLDDDMLLVLLLGSPDWEPGSRRRWPGWAARPPWAGLGCLSSLGCLCCLSCCWASPELEPGSRRRGPAWAACPPWAARAACPAAGPPRNGSLVVGGVGWLGCSPAAGPAHADCAAAGLLTLLPYCWAGSRCSPADGLDYDLLLVLLLGRHVLLLLLASNYSACSSSVGYWQRSPAFSP